MVVVCHIVLRVGHRGCNFILGMLYYIIQLSLMCTYINLSPRDQKLISDFPVNICSATEHLNVEGKTVIYAVCPNPKCHYTYKPTFNVDSPIPKYPLFCSHQMFKNGKPCKEHLLRPRTISRQVIQVPIKPFMYFDFKDWVTGLLSRLGIEDQMDGAWSASERDISSAGLMKDIFDGDMLRQFKGPDKETHFSIGGNEGRCVFSLCVDFFNPYMNKQAGKKASIGLISMVCLNLPPDIRYKPENMYLTSIIPGLREPPLATINHDMTPLVDDLLDFWKPGVRFSRTHAYPHGRLVLCALIALVCDLPGARKLASFSSFSHNHFCSICKCRRDREGYGTTDYNSWEGQMKEEYEFYSHKFVNATDVKDRQAIFDEAGVWWTELL